VNLCFLWPPYGIRQAIIFLPCVFFLSSSFFPHLILAAADWMTCLPYFHTWCGLSANLECSSEIRLLGTIAQFCWAISSQLRHVLTTAKKLVKHQYLPTCSHNMVNFSLLAAEIVSLVWGTPANFSGFRILAALLHSTLVVGVSETLWR